MRQQTVYHIYINKRSIDEAHEIIRAKQDTSLKIDDYTDQGFATQDVQQARELKQELETCLHYAYQTERAARRTVGGRHVTASLDNDWMDVRVVIEPNPDAAHLMR